MVGNQKTCRNLFRYRGDCVKPLIAIQTTVRRYCRIAVVTESRPHGHRGGEARRLAHTMVASYAIIVARPDQEMINYYRGIYIHLLSH